LQQGRLSAGRLLLSLGDRIKWDVDSASNFTSITTTTS
jgi:hypothetical protein